MRASTKAVSLGVAIAALFACGSSATLPAPTPRERARMAAKTQGELTLDVRVRGLRSDDGEVLIALFASERGFPGEAEHAARAERRSISGGGAEARFSRLAPGSYAIAVLHDENASGSLDTGFLGIPSEGLGASNGAQGRFGPADWAEAKFSLEANRAIEVEIRYFP